MSPEREQREKDVKAYVSPRNTKIGPEICPGCMRRRHGIYFCGSVLSPFCDHFCEELWRKEKERKQSRHPWEESRHSFFVEGATGINNPLWRAEFLKTTATERAEYERC